MKGLLTYLLTYLF